MTRMRTTLLILIASLIAGCGFHLRSEESVGIPADSLYLDISGGGQTGREVQQQLKLTDIKLTDSAKSADYVLRVTNERFVQEVLSVSPRTGRVEEYELILRVNLSVAAADGETLIQGEQLDARRDYVYDEFAVVATGDEQQLIREELTRLIASQVLLRARAVVRQHQTNPDSFNDVSLSSGESDEP